MHKFTLTIYICVQRNIGRIVAVVFVIFVTIEIISLCVVHDHEHKKVLVGTVGMIAIFILYASPLSIIVSILYITLIFINACFTIYLWNEEFQKNFTELNSTSSIIACFIDHV